MFSRKSKKLWVNKLIVYSQEELDELLSSSVETLRFSSIELHPSKYKYKLEKIPCGHIIFMRPRNLDLPPPTIELESIYCPEWVGFFEVNLIGGILNLSEHNLISSCYLTEIAINKGTFRQSLFDEGRLNVMSKQKYELLGGKTLPLFINCVLRNCFVEEANICFDFGRFNLLQSTILLGDIEIPVGMMKAIPLKSGNIIMRKAVEQ